MLDSDKDKDKIRNLIIHHISTSNLQDDDDIFELGYVNSFFALQLVSFVEHEFDLELEPDDIDINNFRSVNAICSLIQAKREA